MGKYISALFAGSFILFFYMLFQAFTNIIKKTVLRFPELPEQFGGLSIFFISDIHRREISHKIIEEVKGKADIVIIGGDLLERGVPFSRIKRNLKKLQTVAPTYFVWGNNDYEVNPYSLSELMRECGVVELKNKIAKLIVNETTIEIIGIDDLSYERPNLEDILSDVQEQNFRILVSHNPDIVNDIRTENQISLVLSGHTHGGQIRIFGFGPYELGGIRSINETIQLVSNGYGTTTIPLRLGAKAETHLINIQSKR